MCSLGVLWHKEKVSNQFLVLKFESDSYLSIISREEVFLSRDFPLNKQERINRNEKQNNFYYRFIIVCFLHRN